MDTENNNYTGSDLLLIDQLQTAYYNSNKKKLERATHEFTGNRLSPLVYVTIQFQLSLNKSESNKIMRGIFNTTSADMYDNRYFYSDTSENHLDGYCVAEQNDEGSIFPNNWHYHIGLCEKNFKKDLMYRFQDSFYPVIDSYYFEDQSLRGSPKKLCTNRNIVDIQLITEHNKNYKYNHKTIRSDITNFDNLYWFNKGKIDFH